MKSSGFGPGSCRCNCARCDIVDASQESRELRMNKMTAVETEKTTRRRRSRRFLGFAIFSGNGARSEIAHFLGFWWNQGFFSLLYFFFFLREGSDEVTVCPTTARPSRAAVTSGRSKVRIYFKFDKLLLQWKLVLTPNHPSNSCYAVFGKLVLRTLMVGFTAGGQCNQPISLL